MEESKADAPEEAGRHAQNAQLVEEIIWQRCQGMKPRRWHMADSCCCFKYKTLDGKKSYGQPVFTENCGLNIMLTFLKLFIVDY